MKMAILTSPNQWFIPFAKKLSHKVENSSLFFQHEDIKELFDVLFILSYHSIIPKKYLKHKHNIVIHASDLPKGKGWAPMFWQVLEDKNTIPFTMFEASSGVDNGDIYMQKDLHLTDYELNGELREKQAIHTIDMCLEFINSYGKYTKPTKQSGKETFYTKRDLKDSNLDINKTIKEQFNLLRIVDNENYPAFFELDGHRYILKIELDKMGGVSLLDFVDLTLREKEMILCWRNHQDIKRWMYNTKSIELNEHLRYIDTLELSKTKQYIVVKKDSEYVGVIDFTNIDFKNNSVDFGLYANPNKKIVGVGRVLEETCIKYTFDILGLAKLRLEVFSENTRAMNLYKKFDFKEIGKKIFNNKNVICMELKNNYN